jgi:hypothetical protein
MTSIEDLIRTVLPGPEEDAIETTDLAAIRSALDAQIAGGTGSRVRRSGRAGRMAKPLRFVPAALACAIALAIGAVALTSLHHRGGSAPALTGPAATPAANALISRLAVLRRPQTAADRLPAHLVVNPGAVVGDQIHQGTIIPSLTRLVATRANIKIYLVVTTPTSGPQALWQPSQGDEVAVVSITPHGATQSAGYPAAELSDSAELVSAGFLRPAHRSARTRAGALRRAYDVAIVPDGVARVRWTFANSGDGAGRTVSASVINNVAITPASKSTAFVFRAAWYASDGIVVPSSAKVIDQAIAARNATETRQALAQAERQHVSAPPQLLAAFAVFSFKSPTGTRTPDGYVIAHPPLSKLPLNILTLGGPSAEDLRQVRSVRAPSGLEMWVIPGSNGICVDSIDPPTIGLDGQLRSRGSGGSCSANLQRAIADGAGEDADNQHGAVQYSVVPRTVHTIKIQITIRTSRTIHPVDGVYIGRTPFKFG